MSDPRFPQLSDLTIDDLNRERKKLLGDVSNYSELTDNELEYLGAIINELTKRSTPVTEKRRAARTKTKMDIFGDDLLEEESPA